MSKFSRRKFIQSAIALGLSSKLATAMANKPAQVGVVLDSLFFKHNMVDHPENAQRLIAIDKKLTQDNLWQQLMATTYANKRATGQP